MATVHMARTVTLHLNMQEVDQLIRVVRDKKLQTVLRSVWQQLQEGKEKFVELVARQNSLGHMVPDPTEAQRIALKVKEQRRAQKRQKLLSKISRLPADQREALVKQLAGKV